MKKAKILFSCILFLIISVGAHAQRFRPYHAFGVQVNANFNNLQKENLGEVVIPYQLFNLGEPSLRMDIFGAYDYGFLKWLGVSSGLGFSARGGAKANNTSADQKEFLNIYYLTLPAKLQLKPWKFLWLEPGIEAKYMLARGTRGFEEGELFLDEEDYNAVDVTATADVRINFYKGISLNLGYHLGLTPVATYETMTEYGPVKIDYEDFGFRVGVRYMFNQPAKR